MSTTTMSMPAVVGFIQESADANDLDTVIEAVKARRKLLQDQAAAAVREGLDVTLYNPSPKYFNGLRGTVKSIEWLSRKRTAAVTLDQESTRMLAFSSAKYGFLANSDSYDLTGVPLACCKPTA